MPEPDYNMIDELDLIDSERIEWQTRAEKAEAERDDLREQLHASCAALTRIGEAVAQAGSARAAQLAVLAILNPPEETP